MNSDYRQNFQADFHLPEIKQILNASEPDQIAAGFTNWRVRYEQLSKGKFVGSMIEYSINHMQLIEESVSQQIFMTGSISPNSVSLGVLINCNDSAIWHGHEFNLAHIACITGQEELELNVPSGTRMLSITIPFYLFLELSTGIESHSLQQLSERKHANSTYHPYLAEQIRLKLQQVMREISYFPEHFKNSEVQRLLTSELLGMVDAYLAIASPKNIITSIEKARKVVKVAHAFIEEHADIPISMIDLCNVSFTSRRTLQYCFEKVVGISPSAYLKMIRLNAVKRLLSDENKIISVTEAAATWGFWHLSQFSSDYKKAFGMLPSESLNRPKC